mgnify:FL=1
MSWIWGEKQEKIPMKFTAKTKGANTEDKILVVKLELKMDVPEGMDLVKALRDASVNVEFPKGIELRDVHLANVEIRK